jgi:hypothetical protein
VGVLVVLMVCLAFPSTAAFAKKPHQSAFRMLYTANYGLCGAVGKGIRLARRDHPSGMYISDDPAAFFSVAGMREPSWLPDTDPAAISFDFGTTRFLRGDSAGDGQERLLAVQNNPLGSHGDFATSIWLGKPERQFSLITIRDGNRTVEVPDPETVELLIDFSWRHSLVDPGYVVARLSNGKMRFSSKAAPSAEAHDVAAAFFGGPIMPQEIIAFNERVFVVAGLPLRGPSVVYSVMPDGVEIQCVAIWK